MCSPVCKGVWSKVQGSQFNVQGVWSKVQVSQFNVQGVWFKVQGVTVQCAKMESYVVLANLCSIF